MPKILTDEELGKIIFDNQGMIWKGGGEVEA